MTYHHHDQDHLQHQHYNAGFQGVCGPTADLPLPACTEQLDWEVALLTTWNTSSYHVISDIRNLSFSFIQNTLPFVSKILQKHLVSYIIACHQRCMILMIIVFFLKMITISGGIDCCHWSKGLQCVKGDKSKGIKDKNQI